jgi:hypothetical protein
MTTFRKCSRKSGLECSQVTREPNGYKHLAEVDICRELGVFEVKVPVRFSGTVGFRHTGMDVRFILIFT